MAKVLQSFAAIDDLSRIVEYISRDSFSAASRWIRDIHRVFALLATQPAMGEKVVTQRYGEVRRHVVGSYLIYYRTATEGVEILRVVHGARDQGQAI